VTVYGAAVVSQKAVSNQDAALGPPESVELLGAEVNAIGGYIIIDMGALLPAGTYTFQHKALLDSGRVTPDVGVSFSADGVNFGPASLFTFDSIDTWEIESIFTSGGIRYVNYAVTAEGGIPSDQNAVLESIAFNAGSTSR